MEPKPGSVSGWRQIDSMSSALKVIDQGKYEQDCTLYFLAIFNMVIYHCNTSEIFDRFAD